MTVPSEAAVVSELQGIFPQHHPSLLQAVAKQHNFQLELAVANILACENETEKPIKVRLGRSDLHKTLHPALIRPHA